MKYGGEDPVVTGVAACRSTGSVSESTFAWPRPKRAVSSCSAGAVNVRGGNFMFPGVGL